MTDLSASHSANYDVAPGDEMDLRRWRWADADLGRALHEVLLALPAHGYGPTLTRETDGWRAEATLIDGRRFRRRFVATSRNPVDALETLADKLREAAA